MADPPLSACCCCGLLRCCRRSRWPGPACRPAFAPHKRSVVWRDAGAGPHRGGVAEPHACRGRRGVGRVSYQTCPDYGGAQLCWPIAARHCRCCAQAPLQEAPAARRRAQAATTAPAPQGRRRMRPGACASTTCGRGFVRRTMNLTQLRERQQGARGWGDGRAVLLWVPWSGLHASLPLRRAPPFGSTRSPCKSCELYNSRPAGALRPLVPGDLSSLSSLYP